MPPFSIAGKQLGADDERDLFPAALRLVGEARPLAVMLENVRGLAGARFGEYRGRILAKLHHLGYEPHWQVLNASEFGVPPATAAGRDARGGVIRAAAARDAGVEWTTTVPCRRRPHRTPCAGRLVVRRTDAVVMRGAPRTSRS